MDERVKNLQTNETDAEVSIIGLHEYKLGHVHYQPGYCPQVWEHVLLAVGPVTCLYVVLQQGLCLTSLKP